MTALVYCGICGLVNSCVHVLLSGDESVGPHGRSVGRRAQDGDSMQWSRGRPAAHAPVRMRRGRPPLLLIFSRGRGTRRVPPAEGAVQLHAG